jgi:hypothetical protein
MASSPNELCLGCSSETLSFRWNFSAKAVSTSLESVASMSWNTTSVCRSRLRLLCYKSRQNSIADITRTADGSATVVTVNVPVPVRAPRSSDWVSNNIVPNTNCSKSACLHTVTSNGAMRIHSYELRSRCSRDDKIHESGGIKKILVCCRNSRCLHYRFKRANSLAGALTSEAYPSGRTVITTYDSANRPNQVSGVRSGQPTCAR